MSWSRLYTQPATRLALPNDDDDGPSPPSLASSIVTYSQSPSSTVALTTAPYPCRQADKKISSLEDGSGARLDRTIKCVQEVIPPPTPPSPVLPPVFQNNGQTLESAPKVWDSKWGAERRRHSS